MPFFGALLLVGSSHRETRCELIKRSKYRTSGASCTGVGLWPLFDQKQKSKIKNFFDQRPVTVMAMAMAMAMTEWSGVEWASGTAPESLEMEKCLGYRFRLDDGHLSTVYGVRCRWAMTVKDVDLIVLGVDVVILRHDLAGI